MAEEIQTRMIEQEMKENYVDYAMSVITARALPDVRDGLKPVHRRILYAMHRLGLLHTKPFRKSAFVVGRVMASYHPHGNAPIYDSFVRMAQDFSLRYPLVQGQGNLGCFTGDTKIALTDGRALSFVELVKEHANGKKNFTYTIDPMGNVKISEIKNPRMTKKNASLVRITLNNGEEIRCTPSHLFMTRQGEYTEAQHLTPGCSLMPFYTRLSTAVDDPNVEGCLMIYNPSSNKWVFSHYLSDEWNISQRVYARNRGKIVIRYTTAILNYLKVDESKLFEVLRQKVLNHKVMRVEVLPETGDVYDLTIDDTHNFSLASGIFVHNSIDGDPPAAERYTEGRLAKLGEEIVNEDLKKDTVDFVLNYDNTTKEPTVLPARFPNLLVNGSTGIAVGMATNIPPHNMSEVIDGCVALIENPEISIQALMGHVKAPDFPTGGILVGTRGIQDAYETGKGKIVLKARTVIEGHTIIVTEIPYMVNKSLMIEDMANLVKEEVLDEIEDIRDESNNEGIRVVIELKKTADPQMVLNQLMMHTGLRSTVGINMLCLKDGVPVVMNLKQLLQEFVLHRKSVVVRRTQFELKSAEERRHLLLGIRIAIQHIDAVIPLLKAAAHADDARAKLMETYTLSEKQANAILEMRLQRLTSLETQMVNEELGQLDTIIVTLTEILGSEQKVFDIIKKELLEIKEAYRDSRRTEIAGGEEIAMEAPDFIKEESVVITLTQAGYVKRIPLTSYKQQRRGGQGIVAADVKEEDLIQKLLVCSNKSPLLFFTNQGRVFRLPAWEIPEGTRYSRGKAIVNMLKLEKGETISSVLPITQEKGFLVMVTAKGMLKKSPLELYLTPRSSGLHAINLKEGDRLVNVLLSTGTNQFVIATKNGNAMKFEETGVQPVGRNAAGVIGIRLEMNDEVVGIDYSSDTLHLLTITEKGYGKRSLLSDYRMVSRGSKGVINIIVNERNGKVSAIKTMTEQEEILIVTKKGVGIRVRCKDISLIGRNTQGVRIIKLQEGDAVASLAAVPNGD